MDQNGEATRVNKREMNFKFVTGRQWRRQQPEGYRQLTTPVSYVILSYTMREPCFTEAECRSELKWMQKGQMYKVKLGDIRYNFLLGGDGSVYEIRGWANQPCLMNNLRRFNTKSLYIGFMGHFRDEPPAPEMLEAQQELIKYGVRKNYITPKCNIYTVRGKENSQLSFLQIESS